MQFTTVKNMAGLATRVCDTTACFPKEEWAHGWHYLLKLIAASPHSAVLKQIELLHICKFDYNKEIKINEEGGSLNLLRLPGK